MQTENTEGGGGIIDICPVSPSDQTLIDQNFLKRIEELEKAVSKLLAANISANQLSDLSQQIGFVTGVTYMGVPGWTQTEAGTLIPPPGFSLSGSGLFKMYDWCTGEQQDYQGVSVDSDGVIQFGFRTDGEVCGEKPSQWDEAYANMGAMDYAFYSYPLMTENHRGITVNNTSVSGKFANAKYTVDKTGLYIVSTHIVDLAAGPGTSYIYDDLIININGTNKYHCNISSVHDNTYGYGNASITGLLTVNAGSYVEFLNDPTTLSFDQVYAFSASLVRISS